MMTAKIYEI